MRRSSLATALVVLTAGVTASAVRRLAQRRRAAAAATRAAASRATAPVAVPAAVPAFPVAAGVLTARAAVASAPGDDAVVLAFARPAAQPAVAVAPAAPARCGDTGGRTKAGAPCAARATPPGRCHHH